MKQGSNPFTLWRALKRKLRGEMRVLLTASSVASLVILLRLTGLLQGWELAAFDQWVRLRPLEPVDDRIILVGIDEADLRKIGKWPIPDAALAQLLQRLQAHQPRAIGIDLYRDMPVEPGHTTLLEQYVASNLVAIEQIKDKTSPAVPPPSALNRQHQVGFNNVPFDPDGKVRRGLLYWKVEGKTHQSFSLSLALMYLKAEGVTPQKATDGSEHLQLGNAIFRRFAGDDGSYIRADAGGYQFLANLRGPTNRFAMVSMTDVLEGRVAAEKFRDRIVLIGSTAVSLKDFFPTSYNDDLLGTYPQQPMAGVELQANLISQLLSAALEGRSAIGVWSEPMEWFWIWGWSCVGAQLGWRLHSANKSALAILLSGIGLAGISYLLFLQGSW
ncbi:CHASE2 domain-containing protein, partial [Leptolyngbya sp. FACHB-36]|uniref:CHASE2 domain-containing protein n=1 Tax=Leptolyngbya sp. FACHB-36 TaxID=2692808 RepID=UPI001681C044